MGINYKLVLFIYVPVLLLLIVSTFKDRFEPQNKILKLCNWSLLPAVGLIFFLISSQLLMSFWNAGLIDLLNKFPYNLSNLEIFKFFYYCLCLILVYLLLHYLYKVRISEIFDLKSNHFSLILKVCSILAFFHILDSLSTKTRAEPALISHMRSLDTLHIILLLFVAIVVAPIVEEVIFRGLLYNPLYRKTGRYPAIILSSLIWTYGHYLETYPSITIFAFGIFIGGIILAWLYDKSGSLLPPIIVHMFQNSWLLIYLIK
jgi:CAAX protease family protein